MQKPLHCIRSPRISFLLATDLDGTFLGGRQADRLALYRALRATHAVRLVFVTGRGVETVLPLLTDPLIPDPEYIIGDVGATVVATEGLRPVAPLQWEIDGQWVGAAPVLEALGDLPGLVRQRVPQERRVSFFVDDEALVDEVRARLAHLPVDTLLSAGRYLDVLPRGVSKGDTLRRLVAQLGVDEDRVMVAGDTLNDLSLYHTGFRGVVVGQAEPALTEATMAMPTVHQAINPGAGGILELLREMVPNGRFAPAPSVKPSGDAQLVVVYHRLPFEEHLRDGMVQRRRPSSPNGIIPTLLGCFQGGRTGSWVAWSTQHVPDASTPTHELVDEARFPNLVAAKVPL